MPDHLDLAIAGFRQRVLACQDSAGGGFGVDDVALAALAAELAVGSVYFNDAEALRRQRSAQAGPVRSCALDPESVHHTLSARPIRELAIAIGRRRHGSLTKSSAQAAERDGDVNVLVRVDADDDSLGCDKLHEVLRVGETLAARLWRTGL
jgi:hypothetical protein